MEPYDVLEFSDSNGELIMGVTRSATWQRIEGADPGCNIEVNLYSRDVSRKETADPGNTNQADKARDICRTWVHEGVVSKSFNRAKRNQR